MEAVNPDLSAFYVIRLQKALASLGNNLTLENFESLFGLENVAQIDYSSLPGVFAEWVKENPGMAAFYFADGVLFFCPGLFVVPLLSWLGFGSTGVAAGE